MYSSFIQDELAREHERRSSVDSQSRTSITGSTGLLTLTVAGIAVLRGHDFEVHGAAFGFLTAALIAFLIAGVLALLAAFNWAYNVPKIDVLRAMLTEHWTDTEVSARNSAAYTKVETIRTLRTANKIKVRFLMGATLVQLIAISALAVCALLVI